MSGLNLDAFESQAVRNALVERLSRQQQQLIYEAKNMPNGCQRGTILLCQGTVRAIDKIMAAQNLNIGFTLHSTKAELGAAAYKTKCEAKWVVCFE